MIQRLQTLHNTEVLLSSEELTLGLLEANFEAGLIDLVQVDGFRQNIETERANLIRSRSTMQDAVETFLITAVHLPPTMPIELDDTPIRQFQLISPEINGLQKQLTMIMKKVGQLPDTPSFEQVKAVSQEMTDLVDESQNDFEVVLHDYETLLADRDQLLAVKDSQDQSVLADRDHS